MEKQYRPAWTPEEIHILKNTTSLSSEDLGSLLPNRTPTAIRMKRMKMKLNVRQSRKAERIAKVHYRPLWTPEEEQVLFDNPTLPAKQIIPLLVNRSAIAIGIKRKNLGLSVNESRKAYRLANPKPKKERKPKAKVERKPRPKKVKEVVVRQVKKIAKPAPPPTKTQIERQRYQVPRQFRSQLFMWRS